MTATQNDLLRPPSSQEAERQAILDFAKVPAAEKICLLWEAIQFLHALRPPTSPNDEPGDSAPTARGQTTE